MPEGNKLIPQDLLERISAFEKFLPKEVKNQITLMKNAKRSFTIPVKLDNGYLILAGIVLESPIPAQVMFDEEDLALIIEAVKRAYAKINKDPYEELCKMADSSEVG